MTTRREFIGTVGLGAAALGLGHISAQDSQMPGAPPSRNPSRGSGGHSSIMAIAAHPGDAFFAMGAPVAVQTNLGAAGSFVSLTLGEKGSSKIPTSQYARLQRDAAERAAKLLGAEVAILEHGDGELPVNDEVKFAVCDLIRKYKPAVVVTHWRGSWHKDHRACHDIVSDAIFYAGLPAFTRSEPAHDVRALYYADNWEDATGFSADTFVDISPVCDRWLQACAAFPMWRGENGFRYNDYYSSLAIARGCVGGYQRAVALMSTPEQLTRKVTAF